MLGLAQSLRTRRWVCKGGCEPLWQHSNSRAMSGPAYNTPLLLLQSQGTKATELAKTSERQEKPLQGYFSSNRIMLVIKQQVAVATIKHSSVPFFKAGSIKYWVLFKGLVSKYWKRKLKLHHCAPTYMLQWNLMREENKKNWMRL